MSDKLKPVRCGCGGEAEVRKHTFYRALPLYRVCCRNCGVSTPPMSIVDNAIEAWNTAMGERTAKVDRDTIFPVKVCDICHSTVNYPNKYCSGCGAKLDWSE